MSGSHRPLVSPTTPTQKFGSSPSPRTPSQAVVGRRPLNAVEFGAKQPLREDKVFGPFEAALREAKTLVSFVYKADRCQGKLVPIAYPRDIKGEPVLPSDLLAYVGEHGWETNPFCFCSIRGQERVAVLYVPWTQLSPAFGQVSLVCPESECPYFVNIQEMYEHPESCKDLLSVDDNIIELPRPSPKKRKVRIASWKARASGVTPIIDQFDFVSKLFSRAGITQTEFDKLFDTCSRCNRISHTPHDCVIEVDEDSELDEDIENLLSG